MYVNLILVLEVEIIAIVGDAASGFSESSLFHVSPDHEVSFVLSLYPNGYSIGKSSEAVQQTSFRDAPKVLHPYDRAAEGLLSMYCHDLDILFIMLKGGCFSNDHDVWDVLCTPVVSDENLRLYGLPNGSWEVDLPVDEVPPELPEPALGINFARDGMAEENWVSLIAVHSDSWLISAAFYIGARFSFDKN
ncbi:Alfin protein [Raphanus sativus]|nr:Alfin protein [Raphanus sativus]